MKARQEDDDDEGGGSSSRRAGAREYTGIGVEVRFAAGTKVQKMRELSGGQKVRRASACLACPLGQGAESIQSDTRAGISAVRGGADDHFRHPTMRPGAILPLRRGRCKLRPYVSRSGGPDDLEAEAGNRWRLQLWLPVFDVVLPRRACQGTNEWSDAIFIDGG